MESWISFRLASRARMRGPNFPISVSPPGREGSTGESLSRATLRFRLCASSVKKQEGHVSQAGKESQCPRPQESQRLPMTPGRHRQAPVCSSQTSGRVPSKSHLHAVDMTRYITVVSLLHLGVTVNHSQKTGIHLFLNIKKNVVKFFYYYL